MMPSHLTQLVDTLQVAPRAPWSTVGEVLGVSAVTAGKWWSQLTGSGDAWVTAAPGMSLHNAQCVAYVEITCTPQHRSQVARAIAAHTLAITVELTSGRADVLVTVAAVDLRTLSHYLLLHLDQVEHVLSSRVRIATRLYGEGSAWRLRVLGEPAVRRLEQVHRQQTSSDIADPRVRRPADLPQVARTMLTRLALDGRTSISELAEHAGTSPTTARRHLSQMLTSGTLILRTDVNAQQVGWPVQVYLWADAPVDSLTETARALSRFRQARLTATVTGGSSLALCSWLRTVEELHRLEITIAASLPHVRILDRLVVLRQVKRLGRLLDDEGRAVGVVPINLWDDLLPHRQDGGGHRRRSHGSGAGRTRSSSAPSGSPGRARRS